MRLKFEADLLPSRLLRKGELRASLFVRLISPRTEADLITMDQREARRAAQDYLREKFKEAQKKIEEEGKKLDEQKAKK